MNWGECYFDHYSKFFGEPVVRRAFEPFGSQWSLQVLEYAKVFAGCRVFATLGLSHYSRELGGVAEVIVPSDDGWDDVPPLLANALSLAIREEIPILRGTSIGGVGHISPLFGARFSKEAIYLTRPHNLPEGALAVKCGHEMGKLLLGMFLSAEEAALLWADGPDALEDALEAGGADPFHLLRDSVV